MIRRADKYFSIFKIQLETRLAYPLDLATQSLTIVIFMWVFVQLWRTTYASAGQSSIGGLTLRETLWYLMLAETIMVSKPRLSRRIAEMVKDGSIAYLLNKPYNFLLYQVSLGLGDSLVHGIFNALAGGAIVWLLLGPPPDPRGWPLALICVLLAWLLDFYISILIGLSAFVAEEVSAFEWIYSKLLLLIGGVLIPLDFFPSWLRSAAQSLPFAYTIYAPARLFVDPQIPRFLATLGGQAAWLLVLGCLVWLAYRAAAGRLSVNGG